MSPPPRAIPRQRLLEVCDTTHRLVATAYAAHFCLSQGGDAEATVGERERLHESLRRLVKECVGRMPDGGTPATPQEAEVGDALRAVAACCQIDGQGAPLEQFDGLWHAADRLRDAIKAVPVSLLDGLNDAVASLAGGQADGAGDNKTPSGKTGSPARRIPARLRTRPMSLGEAAKLMGYRGGKKKAAERLRAAIRDGAVICERLSRQNYIFSRKQFPEEVWERILPPG